MHISSVQQENCASGWIFVNCPTMTNCFNRCDMWQRGFTLINGFKTHLSSVRIAFNLSSGCRHCEETISLSSAIKAAAERRKNLKRALMPAQLCCLFQSLWSCLWWGNDIRRTLWLTWRTVGRFTSSWSLMTRRAEERWTPTGTCGCRSGRNVLRDSLWCLSRYHFSRISSNMSTDQATTFAVSGLGIGW